MSEKSQDVFFPFIYLPKTMGSPSHFDWGVWWWWDQDGAAAGGGVVSRGGAAAAAGGGGVASCGDEVSAGLSPRCILCTQSMYAFTSVRQVKGRPGLLL